MATEVMTDDRARSIRRVLMVELGLVVVMAIVSVVVLLNGYAIYGGIVLGCAVVLGAMGVLALRAVQERRPGARKLCFRTGLVLCVLSIPLMPVWIGLITIVTGIGLLVVVFAPERDASGA